MSSWQAAWMRSIGDTWPLCLTGSRHTGWCWIWLSQFLHSQNSSFWAIEWPQGGIRPAEDNVKAIRDFPRPVTVRHLMEFNGMVNFYHRFVPNAAKLMSPLYDATSGMGALVQATRLCHFVLEAPLAISTIDASDFAVGGVLEQVGAGNLAADGLLQFAGQAITGRAMLADATSWSSAQCYWQGIGCSLLLSRAFSTFPGGPPAHAFHGP